MKRYFPCLVALLLLLGSSRIARADNLTFLGTTGDNSGGEYLYPYQFTMNGDTMSLMCMNLDRTISVGESWAVTPQSMTMGDSATEIAQRADGYIFSQMGQYSTSDVQWAVWAVMYPDAMNSSAFTTTAQQLMDMGMAAAVDPNLMSSGFYNQFTMYMPTSDSSTWTNGTPQVMLGRSLLVASPNALPVPVSATPEPGSITLLATGVLGAGMLFLYRRRAQAGAFAATL